MPIKDSSDHRDHSDSDGGTSSNLFMDAYSASKRQLTEKPGETVVAAAAAAVATGALIYMSRGRSLVAAVKSGAAESEMILPEAKSMMAEVNSFPASQAHNLNLEGVHSVLGRGAMNADSSAVRAINNGPDFVASAGESPSALQPVKVGEYRFIPQNDMLLSAPAADSPVIRPVDGASRIVFGTDNSIQQILYPRGAGADEIKELTLQAGYASLIKSDVLAAEAVSKVSGQSIGFISQPIERYASLEEMQQNALVGARAYIRNDAASANRFTHYLTERYGPADFIQKANASSLIH